MARKKAKINAQPQLQVHNPEMSFGKNEILLGEVCGVCLFQCNCLSLLPNTLKTSESL